MDRPRRWAAIALLAAAACASPAHGQIDGRGGRFESPVLDRMVGRWRVDRRMGERSITNTLDVEWVLSHQFLRLHYRDPASPPGYEAVVYLGWNHTARRCVAHWIDVFGGRSSETLGFGTVAGDSLVLDFAYPDGAFRNTYRWDASRGEWTSRGESQDSTGAWRPFMSDRFRRVARVQR